MHPKYKLVYLGNRDEFYSRPTAGSQFYNNILMGRDLDACGTWMGISKEGNIGFLTNYRDMTDTRKFQSTRGDLIPLFLNNQVGFHDHLSDKAQSYKGFNLVYGHIDDLIYFNNHNNLFQNITKGVHGLSNGLLNDPWHKVINGKSLLMDVLYEPTIHVEDLFHILDQTQVFTDNLPETGLDYDLEKSLSAMHIALETYGTVVKQVILITHDNHVDYYEKSIKEHFMNTHHFQFDIKE
jgi:uncharacterized protein with NRDE domain